MNEIAVDAKGLTKWYGDLKRHLLLSRITTLIWVVLSSIRLMLPKLQS